MCIFRFSIRPLCLLQLLNLTRLTPVPQFTDLCTSMPFCSMNSVSSVYTDNSSKNCTFNSRLMHLFNKKKKNRVWNIRNFMHSTVAWPNADDKEKFIHQTTRITVNIWLMFQQYIFFHNNNRKLSGLSQISQNSTKTFLELFSFFPANNFLNIFIC